MPNVNVYIKQRHYEVLLFMSELTNKPVATIIKEIVEKYLDGRLSELDELKKISLRGAPHGLRTHLKKTKTAI